MVRFISCVCVCLLLLNRSFASVDLVMFSYDRPLQLYALLESVDQQVTGLGRQTVIYRASSDPFEQGYEIVKTAFPHVKFCAQDHARARADFKPLLLSALFGTEASSNYVLFAVDDIIVTNSIDLNDAIRAMEKHKAYAFFFRLGLHIDRCYTLDTYSGLPPLTEVEPGIFTWMVKQGAGDWGYPNNVDFTLYRKQDIRSYFVSAPYTFPNDLEALWAKGAKLNVKGMCYRDAAMINIPMNVVSSFNNRQMNYKSAKELLDLFLTGKKIDTAALRHWRGSSPHVAVEPQFIDRL